MARMQRATIEEAAKSLGVPQSVIELQIKSGSLVSCQDPSFRRCVWISESAKVNLRRKTKDTSKDTPKKDLDSAGLVKPANEIGLLRETVAMLKRELEIRDEQLDLVSVELELCIEEVHQLRPLVASIQSPELVLKTEPIEPSTSLPTFDVVVQPVAAEIMMTPAEPPELAPPPRRAKLHYAAKLIRPLRQFVGLVCMRFSPPLFY